MTTIHGKAIIGGRINELVAQVETMQGYLDGKAIEFKNGDNDWCSLLSNGCPSFNFANFEYRLAAENKATQEKENNNMSALETYVGLTSEKGEIKLRVEVMQAHLEGRAIECLLGGVWGIVELPKFNFATVSYRIKKASPDYIDWSHVSEKYSYMATDDSGATWLYSKEPTFGERTGAWYPEGYTEVVEVVEAKHFASFKRGGASPAESLVGRNGTSK